LIRYATASELGNFGRKEAAAEVLLDLARNEKIDAQTHHDAYASLKKLVGSPAG